MIILVLGATGYIGGRLINNLIEKNHQVRCLVRNRNKALSKPWADRVEIIEGQLDNSEIVRESLKDIDVVFYLIHSMASGKDVFSRMDRKLAESFVLQLNQSAVKQVIYLGGLGEKGSELSEHLKSRNEVGDILRKSKIPLTEFRGAVIIGSGSLSFELIHQLVNRLPVMICPRWVYSLTQPIAIRNVLQYLIEAINYEACFNQVIDIGGNEIISYGDMMNRVAMQLGLKRYLIPVPLLTPNLSSYWVNLVTSIQKDTAKSLIESLRHDTICQNNLAQKLFDIELISFEKAVQKALGRYAAYEVQTSWSDADSVANDRNMENDHLLSYDVTQKFTVDPEKVFHVIAAIGGNNGWYYADWIWKLRGFIDKQLGGVGHRRGRRHPTKLAVGDALDFWRVEKIKENEYLLLHAEMKVFGKAWLEFKIEDAQNRGLKQTALYYPRGLLGYIYWYSLYPIHLVIFNGLIRSIIRKSEQTTHNKS